MSDNARLQTSDCSLEAPLLLAVNLASDITQQLLQHVDPLKVVRQPRVLGLALLQEVVLVQDGLERGFFIQ